MTDKEILVLRPLYQMKDYEAIEVRLDIKEQLKRGNVITIPFGWDVVTKPSDTKIEVEEKPEEKSTPWEFIDNNMYSPFDSQGKERLLFCTECGINIGEHYSPMYQYCPYCGKRHYFEERGE